MQSALSSSIQRLHVSVANGKMEQVSGHNKAGVIGDGMVGLGNLGNTCYINSSVQCLSHTPLLTEYFLSSAYVNDVNVDNKLGLQVGVGWIIGYPSTKDFCFCLPASVAQRAQLVGCVLGGESLVQQYGGLAFYCFLSRSQSPRECGWRLLSLLPGHTADETRNNIPLTTRFCSSPPRHPLNTHTDASHRSAHDT